ncbi:phosphotransferase [Paraburkholderia phosphatilytica]|uniref:aminoglycoside phosphotransferase family protein n=1 Tax=Paraburkholderia phosphatilytica TaxID=2282883 RepID=UPI000E4DC957
MTFQSTSTASPVPSTAVSAAASAAPCATDARVALLASWLGTHAARYGLDVATLAPASSDASFRRYFRLNAANLEGGTAIAVDAPPPEKCREFVQVAQLLGTAGVHVPRILETDFDAGLMLVTDLGTTQYINVLNEDNARPLMRGALDALIRWQSTSREDVLPPFDEAFLRREMELMPEWYIGRHLGLEVDEPTRGVLDRTFALLIASARAQPQVFMLRDFMPRNLMIAEPNPGVLDFQDAVYGPITYDVASLLRDAFISWDEAFELDCFAYYWERAKKAGLPVDPDFGEFYRQLEWMGLQRHIKVLGLFARINYRDGKPHYLKDLPRFVKYARKVCGRYRPLAPFGALLDRLEGRSVDVGYTF